ncbi:protein PTHB1-like [Pollicipes pollicipes]|uniref:protein PTHB1-like n=1 Tax=Pollicipes pollicipes TaxID=41117 RepID=UPI0018854B08|nr:protein PTHB1-like [Pollicipes pollicipes]
MSLFKAREWWSTTCGTDETFDLGSMLVASIGPEKQSVQRIVGFIRVYQPNYEGRGDGEEAAENGFRPDDLLLEVQLDQPVLQLMAGHFVHSCSDTCLAVLMPFQVVIFTMNMAAGAVEHGTHYALHAAYSHRLKRSAFNMFSGNFGGSKNKELFCVQALDGTLSFFEQENFAFSRFLPGYLIPGPVLYVKKTDAVVTGTSSWTVEAYKYSSLAQGSDANEKPNGDTGSGKRVYPDWTYNLGEAVQDMQQVTMSSGDVQVAVLAEHSLMVLKETGQLVMFKRLDYHPACLTTFVSDAGRLTTLVSSHTCVLHVYEGGTLRWALVAAYLGTTPSLFVAPPVQTAGALDYEALDEELATLNTTIQKSQAQGDSSLALTSKAAADREVQLVVQIHPVLDPCTLPTELDEQVPCASIRALVSPMAPVQSLVLSFHVTSPLTVVKPSAAIEYLTSTTDVEAVVYLEKNHAIPSLELETVVSYLAPLALVARQADPVKDAEHRVTICTSRPSVNLAQLFSDLSLDPNMSSAAGIEYYTGSSVTILASKTSQRYRLQSDDLHALWLIADELTRRIGALYEEAAGEPICSYISSLPLQDVFAEVDAHLLWRQRRAQQMEQLEQRRRLDRCSAQLSCAVQLVLLLARLSQALSPDEAELLAAALGWRCAESQEQGWHETVDVAAGYLHKSLQQKAGRVDVSSAPLSMPQDTSKLKRHVALLLEKVLKAGAKIGESVNRTELEDDSATAAEATRPPSVQPLSQVFTQRLGSRALVTYLRGKMAFAPPSVAIEPPTPQLNRSRPNSADSVDAEAETNVQHLVEHATTGAGIEVPRDNLLDELEAELRYGPGLDIA